VAQTRLWNLKSNANVHESVGEKTVSKLTVIEGTQGRAIEL
jgi:hypothetical protein